MTKKPMFRNAYDPAPRVQLNTGRDGCRVKQADKDRCDINNIVASYLRDGVMKHTAASAPRFLDVPEDVDYQGHLNTVIAVQAAFEGLPADVRKRFENEPLKFMEFISDPETIDEQIALGLREAVVDVEKVADGSATKLAEGDEEGPKGEEDGE